MRSLLLPERASIIALSLGKRSSILISSFCRKIWLWLLTEIVNGSLFCSSALAWLCGRSIGTPTVRSGADTMNTISNTNITSTNGVTLISLMTGRRRRLLRPPIHLTGELIIENGRRDGGNEADCRGKQSFRDARRDHGERGILRRRDR